MLTKIAENIYCKLVPLPNNPLRDINVYIIKGDDGRALIIDTGFNRPECEEALQEAFDNLVEIRDPADASDDLEVNKIKYSAGSAQPGEGCFCGRETGPLTKFRKNSQKPMAQSVKCGIIR